MHKNKWERFGGPHVLLLAGRPLPQLTGKEGRGCGDASRVLRLFSKALFSRPPLYRSAATID
jgi:hypothetical protein